MMILKKHQYRFIGRDDNRGLYMFQTKNLGSLKLVGVSEAKYVDESNGIVIFFKPGNVIEPSNSSLRRFPIEPECLVEIAISD